MSKNAAVRPPRPDEMTSGFGQRLKPSTPNPALQGSVPAAPPSAATRRTVAGEVRKMFALLARR